VFSSVTPLPNNVAVTTSFQTIGTPVTVTVPPTVTMTSTLVIAEGDVETNVAAFGQALLDVRLMVDGVQVRFTRVAPVNIVNAPPIMPAPMPWHLSTIQPLGPGTHDVHVEVRLFSPTSGVSATADVTAGALSVLSFSR